MRPNTLSEACERIISGTPASKVFPELLDTFYDAPSANDKMAVIWDEPRLTGNPKIDAFVAAAAEYLAKQYNLPSVPGWVSEENRYLQTPWFTTPSAHPAMKEYLAFTSPGEFRSRNIFTEERPLRRARERHPEESSPTV